MYKMSCLRYSQFELYLRGSKYDEIILNKFFKRKIEMIFQIILVALSKVRGAFVTRVLGNAHQVFVLLHIHLPTS